MIKINLLRNIGGKGAVAEIESAVTPESKKLAAYKIGTILLFPLLLYAWERVTLSEAEEKLNSIQSEVQKVKDERAKFGDAGPRVLKYDKEKQRVDKEIEVVRELARNRLREVKALDALQSLIPVKTWARKISIDGNVVKLEGYTTSDDGVTDLIRALENTVFFSRVEPKYTSQEQTATGFVKKFELEFRIGKQEETVK